MFSKSLIALISVFALTRTSVNAHGFFAPALGVEGPPTVDDVQIPSSSSPCGNVDISDNLDNSTVAVATAEGEFFIDVTNFDTDGGLRAIEVVKIDSSGTGDKFDTIGTIISNGDANPTTDTTQQLLVRLAASTVCTGGTDGNLCLVSFITTDGFGNCVVVSQPPNTGAGNSASASETGEVAAMEAINVANTRKAILAFLFVD